MAKKGKWYDVDHPFDASFACGRLTLDGDRVTAFMDDADPVRVDDCQVAELIPTVNGSFTVGKKAAQARITITLVAGSDDDVKFRKLFVESLYTIQSKDTPTGNPVRIEFETGHNTQKYVFQYCVCVSCTPAFSVSSNGKIQGNRYVFLAASVQRER